MDRLMLVDGNNLAMRSAYAFNLSVNLVDFSKDFNPDDVMDDHNNFPTGVLHGFFKSLANIRTHYPEHYIAVVWDGGYKYRSEISKAAVEKGEIPEAYKENRHKKAPDEQMLNFLRQKEELRSAISMTNMPQIVVEGQEADDVIASYVDKYLPHMQSIIMATNDKDYFQLLDSKVMILKSDSIIDTDWFSSEYGGLKPRQWVDAAAFSGDSGDNIFGVPGWGETTAVKAVKEHGSFEGVMLHFHKEFDHLREKHPDIKGEELEALKSIKNSNDRQKYPNISESTPFTGVAAAVEGGKLKMPKVVLTALMYEGRAKLAKVLKQMKRDIALPALPNWSRNKQADFMKFCEKYRLREVSALSGSLCGTQP